MPWRMEGGRFKVFKHLHDWWEEFRLYHRKDGKVFKERDDLMSATRYAVTMLRYAKNGSGAGELRSGSSLPRDGNSLMAISDYSAPLADVFAQGLRMKRLVN